MSTHQPRGFSRPDAQAWYWMGFLGADGCVSDQGMVYLRLQERDRAHVEALRTFVGGGDEGRILRTVEE